MESPWKSRSICSCFASCTKPSWRFTQLALRGSVTIAELTVELASCPNALAPHRITNDTAAMENSEVSFFILGEENKNPRGAKQIYFKTAVFLSTRAGVMPQGQPPKPLGNGRPNHTKAEQHGQRVRRS